LTGKGVYMANLEHIRDFCVRNGLIFDEGLNTGRIVIQKGASRFILSNSEFNDYKDSDLKNDIKDQLLG